MTSVDQQRLREVFDTELAERVATLRQLLLTLDGGRDQSHVLEMLSALCHEAHCLKGAARAVELEAVGGLAHALESALTAARHSAAKPSTTWLAAISKAVNMLPLAASGSHEEVGSVLAALEEAARTSEGSLAPVLQQAKHPPGNAPTSLEPAAAAADHQGTEAKPTPGVESVRVAVPKLDALLAQAGELAVTHIRIEQRLSELSELRVKLERQRRKHREARLTAKQQVGDTQAYELTSLRNVAEQAEAQLQAVLDQLGELSKRLRNDVTDLAFVTKEIENDVMAVRLQPVAALFVSFERLVRDLAQAHGKEVHLVLEGSETEIDRKIIEGLRDPLLHMLRNAVDHGIETLEERQAKGKPRCGTIRLAASQRGGFVVLEVVDDGAGLDPTRLRQAALKKGLLSAEQVDALDEQTTLELIFQPGFSTSASVTETSGRGVGMDVVREYVARLGGFVRTASTTGRGSHFTITVPLTLATTRAILVEECEQLFAIPTALIERNARVQTGQVHSLEGRRTVLVDGKPVPIIGLADLLEWSRIKSSKQAQAEWQSFLVLRQDDKRLALMVDRLAGEQEVVVKRLGWPLRRVRNVDGAAVLGSGETVAILNPLDLLRSGLKLAQLHGHTAVPEAAVKPPRKQRVLVVDDSLTTRTLERSILEAAGYETRVATDGVEALGVLRSEAIDLVLSDIEMPRLDGFALTTEIRRDDTLRRIPVVLVTSLGAPEHRERGAAVGADAYIVKSAFDQGQLLDTIGRLL